MALVALVVAALLGAGCSSKPTAASAPSGGSRPPAGRTTTMPGPGTRRTVTVTDRQNGSSVTLLAGEELRIVLASTYWMFQPSSEPAVLAAEGPPVARSAKGGCLLGEGCGTVTATYTALRPGTARITATRVTCGEALACTGGQGAYEVTVKVA